MDNDQANNQNTEMITSLIAGTINCIKANNNNPDILFPDETDFDVKVRYMNDLLEYCKLRELWEFAAIIRDAKQIYDNEAR